jgi:hypothetical protein
LKQLPAGDVPPLDAAAAAETDADMPELGDA